VELLLLVELLKIGSETSGVVVVIGCVVLLEIV